MQFKGNAQFAQNVTFETYDGFQTKPKIGNITKAASFKSFLHLCQKDGQ